MVYSWNHLSLKGIQSSFDCYSQTARIHFLPKSSASVAKECPLLILPPHSDFSPPSLPVRIHRVFNLHIQADSFHRREEVMVASWLLPGDSMLSSLERVQGGTCLVGSIDSSDSLAGYFSQHRRRGEHRKSSILLRSVPLGGSCSLKLWRVWSCL